jgi:hypothetical protein
MAYTAWVSKNRKLPVRLLKEDEYRSISTCLIPFDGQDYFEKHFGFQNDDDPTSQLPKKYDDAMQHKLCHFRHSDGTPIDGHPPSMQEEEFQALLFQYDRAAIEWKTGENGIHFLHSPYFGEWLHSKGAAINSFLLGSMASMPRAIFTADRDRASPRTTGKYKSWKIGFRMIYKTE